MTHPMKTFKDVARDVTAANDELDEFQQAALGEVRRTAEEMTAVLQASINTQNPDEVRVLEKRIHALSLTSSVDAHWQDARIGLHKLGVAFRTAVEELRLMAKFAAIQRKTAVAAAATTKTPSVFEHAFRRALNR